MMAEPSKFAILQWIHSNRVTALDQAFKAYAINVGQYERVILLAAGIAGVIIPLLTNTERHPAPGVHHRLVDAAYCFSAVVLVGLLILCISRWIMLGTVQMANTAVADQERALGEPATR